MKQDLSLRIGWWTAASPRPRGHFLIPRPPETMVGGCIEPGRVAEWREGREWLSLHLDSTLWYFMFSVELISGLKLYFYLANLKTILGSIEPTLGSVFIRCILIEFIHLFFYSFLMWECCHHFHMSQSFDSETKKAK